MSKKGAPAGKGPVISKGTPSPPRYKDGEQPALPPFSITWNAMGICVETVEESLSPAKVIELVNAASLPDLSITLVDAQEMAEEEMFVEESQLGISLKDAKKDFTDKKKDPTKENWITPDLLSQLLAVRSSLDQDFEHRREESRRASALSNAKKASEDAKLAVEAARGQVAASKEAVKVLIEQERLRVKAEKEAKAAAEAAPPPPPPDPKAKAPPKGKPGAKDKAKEPVAPVLDFKTELIRLRQAVAETEKNLQDAEQKVTTLLAAEATIESSLLAPYVTGRLYWCLGLGTAPTYIGNLAAREKVTFGAVFNIVARFIPAVQEGTAGQDGVVIGMPPLPVQNVPPLVSEMRTLRQASKLFEPARKIAVIDVFYDHILQQPQETHADPKKVKDKKPDKKGQGDDSSVQYESIARALTGSFQKFLLQMRDFDVIHKNSVYVDVPDAIPSKDVDMSYYSKLLSVVPAVMTSVSVIMYCMIEQVACYRVPQSNPEDESKCCKSMENLIKTSFVKTGHNIAGLAVSDIVGAPELCSKLPGPHCSHCPDGQLASPDSCEGQERLIVVHESDKVGHLAAKTLKCKLESTTKWSTPSALDVIQVERKMLQLLPTPGLKRRGMPKKPELTEERKGAYATALNTASHGFFSKTERFRKLDMFSDMLSECGADESNETCAAAAAVPGGQPISNRYYIERFSDAILGQVYLKAKLVLPFEVVRYDQDDDCLLSALYVKDGKHFWKNQVHCQVPFGDYCTAEWASELSRMRHYAYAVERHKALVLEKMWLFFTKGDGLVRCGLPSAYSMRRAPQTTLYKNGNMFLLRQMDAGSLERCFIACLKDDLILYIFIGKDGSLTLQVTSPIGKTFELSSSGVVLMFPPKEGYASECENKNESSGEDVPGAADSPKVTESAPGAAAAEVRTTEANELLSCCSSVVGILKREQGQLEHWRCVLPSGTIVRYMKNGDSQLCFANGNVSNWHLDVSGDSSWVTINNQGDTIAQFQRKEKPVEVQKEEPPPEILGKKDNKKDKKAAPVEVPKVEEAVVVEPEKPSVVALPSKKVVQISDPDTGASILTREDLVVIVDSREDQTRVVQHADGTQVFSTVSVEQVEESGASNFVADAPVAGIIAQSADSSESPGPTGEQAGLTGEHGVRAVAEGENAQNKDLVIDGVDVDVKPLESTEADVPKKEICKTVAWCVKKEGFPTVHGSEGETVKVEFATAWGHYTAGWSKTDQQLSVKFPCGSLLFSNGTTISLKPSDISDPDTKVSEVKDQSSSDIRDWESKNFHLGEEASTTTFMNTGGLYVFDLKQGCLRHTDHGGNGFIAHKGTDADMVVNGVAVKPEKTSESEASDDEQENAPPIDTQNMETSLGGDSRGVESGNPSTHEATSPQEEPDNNQIVTLSLPPAEAPPVIPKDRVVYAGPAARLFAFYEGGHGFEILDEDEVDKYRLTKKSIECHYASNKIDGDAEDAIFHIYVTLHQKKVCNSLKDRSLSCSPFQKDSDVDYAGVLDLSQRHFSLPRVISPPRTGVRPNCNGTIVMYRQISEYPSFQGQAKKEHVSLDTYACLKNVMLELPSYVPKLPDASAVEGLHEQDDVSNRIKEGLAEERLQDARDHFEREKRFAENIMRTLGESETQRLEAAAKREYDLKKKREAEFRKYIESKKKVKCMHKPTDLLQTEGPYKPMRNVLLLYFKCEEGLRALLSKFEKHIDQDMIDAVKYKAFATGAGEKPDPHKNFRYTQGGAKHSGARYTHGGARYMHGGERHLGAAYLANGRPHTVGDETVPWLLRGTPLQVETDEAQSSIVQQSPLYVELEGELGAVVNASTHPRELEEVERQRSSYERKANPYSSEENLKEAVIKVKIQQLCSLTGEVHLKVELVPTQQVSAASKLKDKDENPQPVKVKLHQVGGNRPVKLELLADECAMDQSSQGPVKVKFREVGGARPVKLELSTRESLMDQNPELKDNSGAPRELKRDQSLAKTQTVHEGGANGTSKVDLLPVDIQMHKAERASSPVKVKIHEGNGANKSLKLELLTEDVLMHDKTKEERSASPVKVRIHEGGQKISLELLTEDILMDDITVKAEMKTQVKRKKIYGKEDWIPREDDFARRKLYDKDDWVPREDDSLSCTTGRHSVIWPENEMDTFLRASSTKVVWYPNEKYLERRETTKLPLQTTSMKLLKRLRPTIDRPQFNIAPEVVNFRKMRLGTTAMQVVTLSNYHSDLSRFKISSDDRCIKVVYDHGPLAAGMARPLKVYLKASTSGQFTGKVHIETEFDIFILPVVADVVQI